MSLLPALFRNQDDLPLTLGAKVEAPTPAKKPDPITAFERGDHLGPWEVQFDLGDRESIFNMYRDVKTANLTHDPTDGRHADFLAGVDYETVYQGIMRGLVRGDVAGQVARNQEAEWAEHDARLDAQLPHRHELRTLWMQRYR